MNLLTSFGKEMAGLRADLIFKAFNELDRSVTPLFVRMRRLAVGIARELPADNAYLLLRRQKLRSGAAQAQEMFGALSHFLRPTSVGIEHFTTFPLRRVISEIYDLMTRGNARSASIEFRMMGDSEVEGIRNQLILLFQNLLANAIKYATAPSNPRNAVVSVVIEVANFSVLRRKYPGQLERYGAARGEWLDICIEDNGRGIDADNLDAIFSPAVTNSLEETGVEGTGMGLAIARLVAVLHGGLLFVDTARRDTTCFTLLLARGHADSIPPRELVARQTPR
ncbi:MAG: ATP-binding protein [Devosia nanyangense]|uniref:histidine kinase n=1 Tax=Devosia nanyangense TaxID=1228055 RepID=A0A933P074_9HYPH|nr:ATP-binding protein [Devosia nanyangense]